MRIGDFRKREANKGIEERVAALLNGDTRWSDLVGRQVERQEDATVFPHGGEEWRGIRNENDGALFRKTLQKLVKDWIDSGIAGGMDDPWQRAAPQRIETFWRENPPHVSLGDDDRPQLHFGSLYKPQNPLVWEHNQAFSYFMRLLYSPERERLSRCAFCDRYFVHERRPKRNSPIKRGSFCMQHRYMRKARSVRDTRATRKTLLVRLAADYWAQYERQKLREIRSEWIAVQMNREMRKRQEPYRWDIPITKKWVTQNRDAIESTLRFRLADDRARKRVERFDRTMRKRVERFDRTMNGHGRNDATR